ncbi:transporter [Xylophilus sp. ASV27]|uniref:transporter n=1 Tax=Xylophilus sp. ASV27 TaxID=2795129 RepID=UPI0018EADFD7|nr:transporter [Xylophilus sp. ASV27]
MNAHNGKPAALAAAVFCGLATLAAPAHAMDVNAYDWMPAPDGTSAFILYTPWTHDTGAVLNGNKLAGSVNAAMVMPRYVHYMDVGGHPLAVTALVPYGRQWNGTLGGASLGDSKTTLGDVTLVSGYWLYSNPQERKNIVLAGYLNVPTGTYDRDRALNMSSGQLAATLQLGGMLPLSDKWTLEPTVDATVYRDKSNANSLGQTLSQANVYTVQNWLSYSINATTMFHVGHAAYFGGTKKLDGVENGFNSRKQQVRVGLVHWLSPKVSIYGQVNRDFDVQGGFKGTSGVIRLVTLF